MVSRIKPRAGSPAGQLRREVLVPVLERLRTLLENWDGLQDRLARMDQSGLPMADRNCLSGLEQAIKKDPLREVLKDYLRYLRG